MPSMTKFITEHLWDALGSKPKDEARSYVAVAYLRSAPFERLPLKPNSLLVVNCNESTVKGGATDPREVKKYLDHGVRVHNVSNLHAKVLVLGTRAFVGSANISRSSEGLLEAAVTSTDRTLVNECKQFVQSLEGEEITPREIERLTPLFVTKRLTRQRARKPKGDSCRRKVVPQHNPLWAIRTVLGSWQDIDYEVEESTKPVAEEVSSHDFRVTDFRWPGDNSAFANGVRAGDVVLQVHKGSSRGFVLQPPQRVVLVKAYKNRKRLLVFVEQRKRLEPAR